MGTFLSPNSAEEIAEAKDRLTAEFGDKKVPIIVDLSHAHAKWEGGGQEGQLAVSEGLGDAMLNGVHIDGIMAETYMLSGNQPGGGREPGLSTTDACMDQASAEQLIRDTASMQANRALRVA